MGMLRHFIKENGMLASFGIALLAMLGSLYMSEILDWPPCAFCWYQRICMYPLVLILGIATARKDWNQTTYVIPLTVIGMGLSTYHIVLQKIPAMESAGSSCGIIPCNIDYLNAFGFITIPMLAWTAFFLIFILQLMLVWTKKETAK
jgi:disulfide bond formation protein DsbB